MLLIGSRYKVLFPSCRAGRVTSMCRRLEDFALTVLLVRFLAILRPLVNADSLKSLHGRLIAKLYI